jgi:hypothetical protein
MGISYKTRATTAYLERKPMKRASLLQRFALAVPIVCLLSIALLAQSSGSQNGSNSAATKPSSKVNKSNAQTKTQSTARATSSGATKVTSSNPALPAPPNPADQAVTSRMVPVQQVSPVGEFNGDVRDLPQIPSREHPELELIEPLDYVHNDQPLKTPVALAARPLGPMPALSANFRHELPRQLLRRWPVR